MEKIQTKEMAHNLLANLYNRVEEEKKFANTRESRFFLIVQQKLLQMRHSIENPDNDLFEKCFKNKTSLEIIQWIESESEKW